SAPQRPILLRACAGAAPTQSAGAQVALTFRSSTRGARVDDVRLPRLALQRLGRVIRAEARRLELAVDVVEHEHPVVPLALGAGWGELVREVILIAALEVCLSRPRIEPPRLHFGACDPAHAKRDGRSGREVDEGVVRAS